MINKKTMNHLNQSFDAALARKNKEERQTRNRLSNHMNHSRIIISDEHVRKRDLSKT